MKYIRNREGQVTRMRKLNEVENSDGSERVRGRQREGATNKIQNE